MLAQREYGVFQSIGMDRSQLRQVLGTECLIYVLGALAIAGTLGTGVGDVHMRRGHRQAEESRHIYLPHSRVCGIRPFCCLRPTGFIAHSPLVCGTGKPLVERIRE